MQPVANRIHVSGIVPRTRMDIDQGHGGTPARLRDKPNLSSAPCSATSAGANRLSKFGYYGDTGAPAIGGLVGRPAVLSMNCREAWAGGPPPDRLVNPPPSAALFPHSTWRDQNTGALSRV